MIEAMALASLLSCSDGAWIIEGLGKAHSMTSTEKWEVYREIRSAMPPECDLSQYDFGRPVHPIDNQ